MMDRQVVRAEMCTLLSSTTETPVLFQQNHYFQEEIIDIILWDSHHLQLLDVYFV